MPRKKQVIPSALNNALLAAVIAELPAPRRDGFPHDAREAWITMLRGAFDVVYGPTGRVVNVREPADFLDSALPQDRFYVAVDGYVMRGAKGAKFSDAAGAVIWDERTEPDRGYNTDSLPEFGRTDNIIWADIGTKPDGALPHGTTLQAQITR